MKPRKNTRHYVALALALPILGASAVAMAFPFGFSWMQPASGVSMPLAHDVQGRAGGSGNWGTGSRMDKGIKCSHCHIDPPSMIGFQIDFTPQLVGGTAYAPDTTYQITITLTNEVKVPNGTIQNTLNGFGLTFEGANGQRSGVLRSDIPGVDSQSCPQTFPNPAPTNGTSYVYGNCNAIVFVPKPNTTVWSAGWTSPPAGSGSVTMWYALVDGNQEGDSSLEDDVVEGSVVLAEGS